LVNIHVEDDIEKYLSYTEVLFWR